MTFTNDNILKYYVDIVEKIKPYSTIEIGAFDADFSKLVYKKNISQYIYAFEASSYVYNRYKSSLPEEIQFINLAISDYTGEINFNLQREFLPETIGHNSIKIRNGDTSKQFYQEKISCVSVEDYFRDQITQKDFSVCLWIDVEGSTKEVFMGMLNMLKKYQVKSILVETEHIPIWNNAWLAKDVENFLNSNNFYLHKREFQYGNQSDDIYLLDSLQQEYGYADIQQHGAISE